MLIRQPRAWRLQEVYVDDNGVRACDIVEVEPGGQFALEIAGAQVPLPGTVYRVRGVLIRGHQHLSGGDALPVSGALLDAILDPVAEAEETRLAWVQYSRREGFLRVARKYDRSDESEQYTLYLPRAG